MPVPITATVPPPARRVQRAFVRGGVDAQGQSADHAPAMRCQMAGEGARVFLAAGRGAARAHHGQRRALQEGRLARDHQQDGRIGNGQQALGIAGIGQRQDVVVRRLGPFQAAFHLRLHVRRHGRGQLARQRFGQVARQRRGLLRVDLLGQAQRAEQRAGGGRADVRLQDRRSQADSSAAVWVRGMGRADADCGRGWGQSVAWRGPPAGVDRIAHRPCAENGP